MSHLPLDLSEYSLEDLFNPWNPENDDTLESRDASSRVLSCPNLVHYLLSETVEGRSKIIDGRTKPGDNVSDAAVKALESQVLDLGGESFTSSEPANPMIGATTFILLGSNVFQYSRFVQTNNKSSIKKPYNRGIAWVKDHQTPEAASTTFKTAVEQRSTKSDWERLRAA